MAEKIIQIPEWQFKKIENALRLAHRICNCNTKETAFDREVVGAWKYAKEALITLPEALITLPEVDPSKVRLSNEGVDI